jgi:hypothetical protein
MRPSISSKSPLVTTRTTRLILDDEEGGEGDDEEGLEEIDAGVFEEAVNKTAPSRRTTNYSKIKDEALIKA